MPNRCCGFASTRFASSQSLGSMSCKPCSEPRWKSQTPRQRRCNSAGGGPPAAATLVISSRICEAWASYFAAPRRCRSLRAKSLSTFRSATRLTRTAGERQSGHWGLSRMSRRRVLHSRQKWWEQSGHGTGSQRKLKQMAQKSSDGSLPRNACSLTVLMCIILQHNAASKQTMKWVLLNSFLDDWTTHLRGLWPPTQDQTAHL